jgi:hypothetical protein
MLQMVLVGKDIAKLSQYGIPLNIFLFFPIDLMGKIPLILIYKTYRSSN